MGTKCNINIIKEPAFCEDLAELVGIILGDGNLNAYIKGTKKRNYALRIAGHKFDDKEYLEDYVAPLIEKLFSIKTSLYNHQSHKCKYVVANGKAIIDFFERIGLKPGNKLKNNLTIPSWIYSQDSFLRACLRGLFDTDGSVYELLPHWPGIFQINFTGRNSVLVQDVRDSLQKLGFSPSEKYSQETNGSFGKGIIFRVVLTRKADIKKFYKEINSSNPKHLKKIGHIIVP